MIGADIIMELAKNSVNVPTVGSGSQNIVGWIVGGAGLVLGGGGLGAYLVPIITAKTKRVRQVSDAREDAAVENTALKEAAEIAMNFAREARTTAKEVTADLRAVIADKDKQIDDQRQQIADQRQIIEDYRDIIARRDSQRDEDRIAVEKAQMRLVDAETKLLEAERREQVLIREREAAAVKVRESEEKIAEATLSPERIEELKSGSTHGGPEALAAMLRRDTDKD